MVCSVCSKALTLSEYFLCSRASSRFCTEHEPMDALRQHREELNRRALNAWQPAPEPVRVTRVARDETGRVFHG